jgi:hypothetical protein
LLTLGNYSIARQAWQIHGRAAHEVADNRLPPDDRIAQAPIFV